MQATPEVILGTTIGLIAALFWAIGANVYKSQSKAIRPVGIAAIKMWVAFIFMLVLVVSPIKTEPFSVPQEAIFFLGVSVLCGGALGDTVYLLSQDKIGVSYAFPISRMHPIMTYLLAIPILGEEPSMIRFGGVVVGVIGIVIISHQHQEGDKDTDRRVGALGVGLAVLSALLASIAMISLQIGATGINPIDASFVRITIGSLLFLPAFGVARSRGLRTPRKATIKVIVAGFFGMALGSLMYVYMVQLVGAATASLITSTSIIFAVPISVIFLKEKVTPLTVLGILIAVVGVIVVVSTT